MKKILPLIKSPYLLLFLAVTLIASGCNKDEEEPSRTTDSIVDVITETEGLDSLTQILNNFTGLQNRLASGEYTVFAPNNAAFQRLLQSIGLETMSSIDPGLLNDILLYHVVANDILNANQLDSSATTLNVDQLSFSQGDSTIINAGKQASEASIVTPNIEAANGVVHIVDEVILPASFRNLEPYFGTVLGITATIYFNDQVGGLATITNLLTHSQAGLSQTLRGAGPFTILAPLDVYADFAPTTISQLQQMGNLHILPGNVNLAEAGRTINTQAGIPVYVTNIEGEIFLNGVPVVDVGLEASNGKVLPMFGTLKAADTLSNILINAEIATGNTFNIFRAALRESKFKIGTDRTIFIPTDQAFEAAGLASSIDSLATDSLEIVNPEMARLDPAFLTNILQTHVINGINFSSDIIAAESTQANALNEVPLTLAFTQGTEGNFITVGSPTTADANVVLFDQLSTQGAVHIINKVLVP